MSGPRVGPRGARDGARRESPWGLVAGTVPFALLFVAPLLALVLFLDPAQFVAGLRSPTALHALGLTLRTTLVATLLCAAIGTPVALLLARRRFRGRIVLETLVDLPLAIPPVVAGLALLLAFGRYGLLGRSLEAFGVRIAFSPVAVVLAQVFIACPFFVRAARAGFESVDPALEGAARVLGASRRRVFWTVTLPLARPAVTAGLVLAWARALSEFGATVTFAGNFPGRTQTLSLAVMSALESDLPAAVSIAMVSLLLAVVALLAARRLSRRAHLAGL